jgi:hypothetical protein
LYIDGPEQLQCPPEYQDRITRMFGINQFGEPNFKIVWGQSQFIRLGNKYKTKDGDEWIGYRDAYQCHKMPCWVIMRWKQPESYGSPEFYFMNSWMSTGRTAVTTHGGDYRVYDDVREGFYVTGDYPWTGRYEIVQPLMHKEFVRENGQDKLVIEHMELSHILIDAIIPMILAYQELSLEEREAARDLVRREEEKKRTEEIADRMADAMPVYWNPVSYSHQGCRTALIDRKMEMIQKAWDHATRVGRAYQRGFAQGVRPRVVRA